MSAEIISFTHHRTRAVRMAIRGGQEPRKNMHSLVFRNRAVILEIDEATLLRDVCFDFGKAERKLTKLRRHLKSFKERTTREIEILTAVEAKLGAAVDAARLELEGAVK
jgi:hypothetical protein